MALLDALSKQQQADDQGNAAGLNEKMQAAKAISSGALQNKPVSAPAKPRFKAAPVDKVNPSGKYGDKAGEKRLKLGKDGEILGSYKKGGKVKKTGVYRLHKGERVLNKKQTAKAEKGMKAVLSGKA